MKTSFILFIFSITANAENCQELYQKHLKTDLELSYKAFDQTMGEGFRSLVDKSGEMCHKEIADLIEKYIEVNHAEQSSLRWHIAQSRANDNDYAAAIKYSKSVLLEHEDFNKRALRWNDYVLGTIAFLEHNKEKLIAHRNKLEEAKDEHFGNKLNLKYMDSLIKNFDKNYNYASSHIE